MTTQPSFNTDNTWAELTSVTETAGVFVIQNNGGYDVLIYVGEDPTDGAQSAIKIDRCGGKSCTLTLSNVSEKVWVKSTTPSRLSILQVSSGTTEPFNLKVTQGRLSGYTYVDKYGENDEVDTGTVPEDVTQIGGEYTYDDDNTAPIVSIISDSASDTQVISIQGLDINGNLVNQEATLNGTTRVALDTPLWRVFRMENEGTTDIDGNVYCYIGTGGVPTTEDTRAIIQGDNNQTLMAIYTVPLGKVGFLVRGETGMTRSQSTGTANIAYRSRRYGKIFKTKKDLDVNNQGSNIYQDTRSFPDVIPALTDIKISILDVSANSTGIFATFDILLADEEMFTQEYLTAIGQPSST